MLRDAMLPAVNTWSNVDTGKGYADPLMVDTSKLPQFEML